MRKIWFLLIITFTCNLFAEVKLDEYSKSIHPLMDEVTVFYEDESFRYRVLIYRGGYEHVSAYMVIQKYSVNFDGSKIPYQLLETVTFDEINKVYNFKISSIVKEDDNFIITLDATHSYLYNSTTIKIELYPSMEYEIISGLIDIL